MTKKKKEPKEGDKGPCEKCGKEGKYCTDPFMYDVWNETVWKFLCDECYQNSVDDI